MAWHGHFQYAKCARLYLQSMRQLPETHPWLHEQFERHGFHTVHKFHRYWSGLWTDLVTEQVLVRPGLTRGRGMTESVQLTCIHSMHSCAEMHSALTSLTNLAHMSSDQHKEVGTSRAARDRRDLKKMMEWFTEKDPFSPLGRELYSLSTGLTASADDGINCDCAEEVGTDMQQHLDSAPFINVSLKRRDCVKTLQWLCKGVTVEKKTLLLHTAHLFSRLIALVQRTNDMEPYFAYELTTLPAALFKDSLMRKPDKAGLGNELTKHAVAEDMATREMFVLDGESLLHKVKWPKVGTYHDVVMCYVRYVRSHFGSQAMIVFDGYNSGSSIKDHEHRCRSTKCAASVQFDETRPVMSSCFLPTPATRASLLHCLADVCQRMGILFAMHQMMLTH